jgi:hypothetical protein
MIQKPALPRALAVALSAVLCFAMAAPAWSAGSSTEAATGAPASKKKSKPAKAKSSKVKFQAGSEESPADRRNRLKAECKGQVNAGVCAGYTR